jgi:MFS family permease
MTTAAKTARVPWGLVILLFFAMWISFFDRGNLAVAAPLLAPELGLSPVALGVLLSAFFWTYAAGQLGAAWLVDRIEVRWAYAAGFLLWSLATLSTAAVSTFSALLCLRLLLGVGEAVAYPASSRIVAAVVPEHRRGLANSVIDLGARLGPAVGILMGAQLVGRLGWRGLFLITGSAGLIWLIPWLACAPRVFTPVAAGAVGAGPGWKELLRRRDVWGTCCGLLCANYAWYFLLSWLPSYLVKERQFSMNSLSVGGALPFFLMAITSIGGGILSDRWISRGASPIRVRRGFLVTGLLMTAVFLPTVLLPRIEWALAGLFLSCLSLGVYASNLWPLTQTLAGPMAAARWTGFQNAFGNLAGIVGPIVTGWIVASTGRFAFAFLAASLACGAGAASFGLLVRDSDAGGG